VKYTVLKQDDIHREAELTKV